MSRKKQLLKLIQENGSPEEDKLDLEDPKVRTEEAGVQCSDNEEIVKKLTPRVFENNVIYGEIEAIHLDGGSITLESGETAQYMKHHLDDIAYKLEEGDCVKVKYVLDDDEEIQVLGVSIELEADFKGLITQEDHDWIVVNHNIIFPKSKLPPDTFTRVGDGMTGTYLKTTNTQHPYRAVFVNKMDNSAKEMFPNFSDRHLKMQSAFLPNKKDIYLNQSSVTLECSKEKPREIFNLKVTNISARNAYTLVSAEIKSISDDKEPISRVVQDLMNTVIPPNKHIVIKIEATVEDFPAIYNERLTLYFEKIDLVVAIQVIAGNEEFRGRYRGQYNRPESIDPEELYSTYIRNQQTNCRLRRSAKKQTKIKIKKFLPPCNIPPLLKLNDREWLSYINENFEYLLDPVSEINYVLRWRNCLFIAELHANKMVRDIYDQNRVVLQAKNETDLYVLDVPNVAEKRPSIMPGDKVACHVTNDLTIKGVLVKVLRDQVVVEMDPDYEPYVTNQVDVNFIISDIPYRVQHEALESILSQWGGTLFPEPNELGLKMPIVEVEFDNNQKLVLRQSNSAQRPMVMINKNLNISQLTTIRNVLRGEHRPAPYLISGPPGTGKTTTLVEIIGQLVSILPTTKLLVCAQSNSAANLILKRLLETKHVDSNEILRIMGHYKLDQEGGIPEELKKYCGVLKKTVELLTSSRREDGVLINCELADLIEKRVLIVTCGSVGYLTKIKLPEDHFSHLILDEAGQCLETETIVPMSVIHPRNGQIIMAGDAKQLGPVIQSDALKHCKYDLSLFERLLQTPLYSRTTTNYNPVLSNLLVYNYRSVPSVLKIYNDLFYEAKLKAMIKAEMNPLQNNLQTLFPGDEDRSRFHSVFFYDVMGEDRQCEDNPSWMNLREAEVVKYLNEKLLRSGVKAEEIGIISPYQGQVKHLKSILPRTAVIGSVAEFQGQEKQVIILSTVRSNVKLLEHDQKYEIGFLSNEKQINVAVSRAQYLLLIVGNASLLNVNPKWRQVIHYAVANHAYIDSEKDFLQQF